MSRNRIRKLTPDRLKRHQAGIRRLDEAFGVVTPALTREASSALKKRLFGIRGES